MEKVFENHLKVIDKKLNSFDLKSFYYIIEFIILSISFAFSFFIIKIYDEININNFILKVLKALICILPVLFSLIWALVTRQKNRNLLEKTKENYIQQTITYELYMKVLDEPELWKEPTSKEFLNLKKEILESLIQMINKNSGSNEAEAQNSNNEF